MSKFYPIIKTKSHELVGLLAVNHSSILFDRVSEREFKVRSMEITDEIPVVDEFLDYDLGYIGMMTTIELMDPKWSSKFPRFVYMVVISDWTEEIQKLPGVIPISHNLTR